MQPDMPDVEEPAEVCLGLVGGQERLLVHPEVHNSCTLRVVGGIQKHACRYNDLIASLLHCWGPSDKLDGHTVTMASTDVTETPALGNVINSLVS